MKKLILLFIISLLSININAMYTDKYGNIHSSEPAAVNLSDSYYDDGVEIGRRDLMNRQTYDLNKMKNKTDYHADTIFNIGIILLILVFAAGISVYMLKDNKNNNN